MKCCTVPGPSTFTDLPFSSLMELMLLRTTSPSPPFDLSISATCTLGMPAELHTMCWSTVVAAALSAPEASAAERCTGGMKRVSMSTPVLLKMPASSASFRGWKPVQPLMPSTTFSCASAANATPAATMKASHFIFGLPEWTRHSHLTLATPHAPTAGAGIAANLDRAVACELIEFGVGEREALAQHLTRMFAE